MKTFLLLAILGLLTFSCTWETLPEFPEGEVLGYRPVYGDSAEAFKITTEAAFEPKNPGKIYLYNNLLLVNEVYEGIHVINNANPADPKPLYFIRIPGNIDVAMKNDVIYADNFNDLLAIQITAEGVQSTKRLPNVVRQDFYQLPPASGYFECVDASKGVVVDWEEVTLRNPKCFH